MPDMEAATHEILKYTGAHIRFITSCSNYDDNYCNDVFSKK